MEVTPEAVTLTVPELRALMAHASTDDTRPHLDAARSRCFATDGQRAVVVQARADRVGPAVGEVVVPLATLEVARRAVKADGHITIRRYAVAQSTGGAPALAAGANHVGVEVHDRFGQLVTAIHVDCKDHRPPPIDQVMPERSAVIGTRTPVAGMATAYLAALATISKATGSEFVEIWPGVEQLDPWSFTATSKDGSAHWTVVIMPARCEATAVPPRPASATATASPVQLPAPVAAPKRGRGRKAA